MTTKLPRAAVILALIALLTALALPANAQTPVLRIALEDVDGVQELQSGNYAAGIKVLKSQLRDESSSDWGRVAATLCGAYVLAQQYKKASRTCEQAVEHGPEDTAHNNRGVLRAYTGDIEGAKADFDLAQPGDVDQYLEVFKTTDPRLVAAGNYEELEFVGDRIIPNQTRYRSVPPAEIEDLIGVSGRALGPRGN